MKASHDMARWERVKALLAAALEQPPHERQAFIERASAGDPALRAELGTLVAAAGAAESLLDEPAADTAVEAPPHQPAPPGIGRRVGAYRLLSLLGSGGMGQVYQAERADGQYHQQVAVKLMHQGLERAGLEARFKAERRILASLDHPHLAKVMDGGITDDGVPYFVMELVAGEPIDAYCHARSLPVEERLRLFRTVCQVVHYAHRQGVVHRDLKPANILVTRDGVVKLVDFGIARQITAPAPETVALPRVMTLEYASPEQVRAEPATPASDVFSLGVVLYRLLSGTGPYPAGAAGSDYELSKAICETEPAPPSQRASERPLRKRLRGDLDAVALMALRKNPAHRYPSAEALADDVFRHLEGLPVQARRGAWSYRAGRFVLRHRAAVGAALVANLALVAGLSFAAYQAYEATHQRARAERHFASVRKLANVFIFDVYKAIERVPGSLVARKKLLDTAINYLEELRPDASADPALQLELAAGYRQVGDIQGASSMSNFGQRPKAMESYRHAQQLAGALAVAGNPHRLSAMHELVLLHTRIGGLLDDEAKFAEAQATHEEGVRIARALTAAAPANAAYQRALGNQYIYLAQMYFHNDDDTRFHETSKLAEEQLKTVLSLMPQDVDVVANLAAVYGLRGLQLMGEDLAPEQQARGLAEIRKGIAAMAPAYERNPDHLVLAPNYAKMLSHAGDALLRMGRRAEAVEFQRRSLEIEQRLLLRSPNDVRSIKGVGEAQASLAETLIDIGDADGAVAAAEAAVRVHGRLPPTELQSVRTEYYVGWALYVAGNALHLRARQGREPAHRQADLRAACQRWREALPVLQANHERQAIPDDRDGPQAVRDALKRCA
jgi:tRNA A-37 threonylcarbamoyl transferase component Bud32/tetratricopeptide (TPR) repeat protein